MICKNCGQKNEAEFKFCASCGAPLTETDATPSAQSPDPAPARQYTPPAASQPQAPPPPMAPKQYNNQWQQAQPQYPQQQFQQPPSAPVKKKKTGLIVGIVLLVFVIVLLPAFIIGGVVASRIINGEYNEWMEISTTVGDEFSEDADGETDWSFDDYANDSPIMSAESVVEAGEWADIEYNYTDLVAYSFIDLEFYTRDKYNLSDDEIMAALEEEKTAYYENIEADFGGNLKITVEVLSSRELDEEETKEVLGFYPGLDYYHKCVPRGAAEVKLHYIIEGDLDSYEVTYTAHAIKGLAGWYYYAEPDILVKLAGIID